MRVPPPIERPEKPAAVALRLARRPPPLSTTVRRTIKRLVASATDRGWLGLTPLQAHVVICGFPRSGTTLLLLIAEACYPSARTFHRERFALRAAEDNWRGAHHLMFTKKPDDIYWVDEVRTFYRGRHTQPRFVVCIRDPRSVLTSVHPRSPGYYVSPERWQSILAHVRYARQFDDVLIVKFEDLITNASHVQTRFADFIGWQPEVDFERFHQAVPEGFRGLALNGLRPLDAAAIDRWRAPSHHSRIREVLAALPDLPAVLVELGYEADSNWTEAYLRSREGQATAPQPQPWRTH